MSRLLAILLTLQLLVCAVAQERRAVVRLEDGSELRGTVVAMDLELLQLRTTEGLVKIPAVRIRKCTIETVVVEEAAPGEGSPQPAQPAPAVPAKVLAATPPPAEAAPATQGGEGEAQGDKGDGKQGDGKQGEGAAAPPADPGAPPAAPSAESKTPPGHEQSGPVVGDPVALAPDVAEPAMRQRYHWKTRLTGLSDRFPWLVPSDPAQWVSMALLLLATLSLSIYSSTRLASGENQEFGRAVVLSVWFLVTGALQVALVPVNDLSAVIMLLVNPALALLWLRVLFALSRSAALVAFTIQLGFLVVGYGVLELLDSILRSINAPVA